MVLTFFLLSGNPRWAGWWFCWGTSGTPPDTDTHRSSSRLTQDRTLYYLWVTVRSRVEKDTPFNIQSLPVFVIFGSSFSFFSSVLLPEVVVNVQAGFALPYHGRSLTLPWFTDLTMVHLPYHGSLTLPWFTYSTMVHLLYFTMVHLYLATIMVHLHYHGSLFLPRFTYPTIFYIVYPTFLHLPYHVHLRVPYVPWFITVHTLVSNTVVLRVNLTCTVILSAFNHVFQTMKNVSWICQIYVTLHQTTSSSIRAVDNLRS